MKFFWILKFIGNEEDNGILCRYLIEWTYLKRFFVTDDFIFDLKLFAWVYRKHIDKFSDCFNFSVLVTGIASERKEFKKQNVWISNTKVMLRCVNGNKIRYTQMTVTQPSQFWQELIRFKSLFIYVFWRGREKAFHLLLHSWNNHTRQSWARLKVWTRNSILMSHISGRDPEQLRLELG